MKRTLLLILSVFGLLASREAQAFYNPSTGKWLSRDPIEERGGLNLYAQAKNNSVNFADADGRDIRRGHDGPPAPGDPDFPAPPLSPGQAGFEFCRRDALGDDCCTKMGNFKGGIHSALRRTWYDSDGNPHHEGWGFDESNAPRPEPSTTDPLINPKAGKLTCAACTKTGSSLQYGKSQGKPANKATDDEIWDCIKNTPSSRKYDTLWYNCKSYAYEAAGKCGLSCPYPQW